ncbi:MAG: hypothetical protein C4557_04185 [Anaerolineaceae bacterium]|jgi:hypothetical protein|nr:MAG: hypothetical protein C4557_04185 [Anaerolineaceae bacterium]
MVLLQKQILSLPPAWKTALARKPNPFGQCGVFVVGDDFLDEASAPRIIDNLGFYHALVTNHAIKSESGGAVSSVRLNCIA